MIAAICFTACAADRSGQTRDDPQKVDIVCTGFPEYDFMRQIAGSAADVHMLLKPGQESHSYEPTPADMLAIKHCDLFVYCGGESDKWVEEVLDSVDEGGLRSVKLMDLGDKLAEDHEKEYDEHVWTSPVNAQKIVAGLTAEICEVDPGNAEVYKKNAAAYIRKLQKLDGEFRRMVKNSKRKTIVVADRFPFKYLCREYGLKYYAAYPGCATETEPGADTITKLIRVVNREHIPVVFHIELSNREMSRAIAGETGTRDLLLHSAHNISESDFKAGKTYLDLMEHDLKVLKEALN